MQQPLTYPTGLRLERDVKAERITNSQEANALLHYEYRGDWKLS